MSAMNGVSSINDEKFVQSSNILPYQTSTAATAFNETGAGAIETMASNVQAITGATFDVVDAVKRSMDAMIKAESTGLREGVPTRLNYLYLNSFPDSCKSSFNSC